MSMFNAINLLPRDEEVEEEEHTIELQVETGFKLYEEALKLMNQSKFDEADEKFKQLFGLDILVPDKWGKYKHQSPSLDRLRYLSYRNRAMYYYFYLSENYQDSMPSSELVNYTLKVMEYLVESLQHSEADSTVIAILMEVFSSFKSTKLERLTLEYELNKHENQLLLLGRHRRSYTSSLLPCLSNMILEYHGLLNDIQDIQSQANNSNILNIKSDLSIKENHQIINYKFKETLGRIFKLKTEDENVMKTLALTNLEISETTWECFAKTLKNQLPYVKMSTLLGKNSDPYNEIEYPIEGMTFTIKEPIKIENTLTVDSDVREIEDTETKNKLTQVSNSSDNSVDNKNNTTGDSSINKRRIELLDAIPKQRSSKRVKTKEMQESQTVSSISNTLHKTFNTQLESEYTNIGCHIPIKYTDLSLKKNRENVSLIFYDDLYQCLKSWNSWHTEIFKKNDKNTISSTEKANFDLFKLNSLLRNELSEDTRKSSSEFEPIPDNKLFDFITKINKKSPHFHEIRFMLIEYLLNSDNITRYITAYLWSEDLYKIIQGMVLSIESNLYEYVAQNLSKKWYLGLSIYEILVNMLGQFTEEIVSKNSNKNKVSDLKTQRNKLEKKINRLHSLLISYDCALEQQILLKWIYYTYLQYMNDVTGDVTVSVLTNIIELSSQLPADIVIEYPNYACIQTLDTKRIEIYLKRINAVKRFMVINLEDIDQEIENINNLEKILLHNSNSTIKSIKLDDDMINFIQNAPLTLKIKLWDFIFSYYLKANDIVSLKRVYINLSMFLLGYLSSGEYQGSDKEDRMATLLSIFSILGSFSERIAEFMDLSHWKFNNLFTTSVEVDHLLKLFYFYYPILYFESNCESIGCTSFFSRVTKSSARLKEYITAIISLLIYFTNNYLELEKKQIDGSSSIKIISNFHTLLGELAFCDSLNQLFLGLIEKILCKYVNYESYSELKPVLWCKYHFSTASDSFLDKPHSTIERPMTKSASLILGIYLLKLQYQHTHPILYGGNKNIPKQIFDKIIETIGDVITSEKYIIIRNHQRLKDYLNQPITISTVKKCLAGKLKVILSSPNDELQEAIDAGIFYVSSVQALGQYVQRKKMMQARPSELDYIIKNITTDILYNTQRYESWYILGQCYSFLVEDDLIWTADKIVSKEKKNTIAVAQRKVILCLLMSLSLLYSKENRDKDDNTILKMVLESLGKELTISYYKPMEKTCFEWNYDGPILKLSDDIHVEKMHISSTLTMSDFNIQQLILLCFSKAIELENNILDNATIKNWMNYYFIAKLLFKFNREDSIDTIFEKVGKACTYAMLSSEQKDAIIEPHYALVVMCYKYVLAKTLTRNAARDILRKDVIFKDCLENDKIFLKDREDSDELFYQQICTFLEHLISLDKKNWHHRLQYRMARIYFEQFKDYQKALELMDKFISIRSNKSLINIWKPDLERPGKHFVYTYQYVIFYVDLLVKKGDFNSIGIIIRKIRRFGSAMAYVNNAIDYSIKRYIDCVYQKLNVNDKYIETLLPNLNYNEFLSASEELGKTFDSSKYSNKYTEGLKLAYQLKRSSNGITFDGPCLAIYFKIFFIPGINAKLDVENKNIVSQSESNEDNIVSNNMKNIIVAEKLPTSDTIKNSSSKKRVSKKEAFDRIKDLIEKIPNV
ncbi:Hir3p PWA37_002730 [Arxiozyma heterogenica]|uniref:Hir3p n=1 Tax=Arxiozyma heterogenica TaxID=278026 RepID=UPI002EF736F5